MNPTFPTPARLRRDAIALFEGSILLIRDTIRQRADDTDDEKTTETVELSYRGVNYEVDLSEKKAAALDRALAPYLDAARLVKASRPSRAATSSVSTDGARPKEVRTWARNHGIEVSDRGRLSVDVKRRYRQAHGG